MISVVNVFGLLEEGMDFHMQYHGREQKLY
jgi:hypothetical protein